LNEICESFFQICNKTRGKQVLQGGNSKGRRIGDVELPGVDGDENETPPSADVDALDAATVEHDYDLDSNPNDAIAEEVVAQTIEPEVETVHDGKNDQAEPAPDQVHPATVHVPEEAPGEIPGVRRSTRVRLPTKPGYIPSMSGSSKYVHVVTQLESQGALFATGRADQ
jgi:hypothetical protein